MPLGALIYWLGAMLFKGALKYMQALLVWTYATLPSRFVVSGQRAHFVCLAPYKSVSIVNGASGVFKPNLGALFTFETLPIRLMWLRLTLLTCLFLSDLRWRSRVAKVRDSLDRMHRDS
jgi:hypothetical protein